MSSVDHGVIAQAANAASQTGHLWTLTDSTRDLRYMSADGILEPASGHVAAWCKGDGTTTSFTIGRIPANCLVKAVDVVLNAAGTAATTVAIGRSGATGAYMSASSFSSSMDTPAVKTVTTVKVHETTARTVLATFSTAWDAGAKLLVVVHYVKVAPVPA